MISAAMPLTPYIICMEVTFVDPSRSYQTPPLVSAVAQISLKQSNWNDMQSSIENITIYFVHYIYNIFHTLYILCTINPIVHITPVGVKFG